MCTFLTLDADYDQHTGFEYAKHEAPEYLPLEERDSAHSDQLILRAIGVAEGIIRAGQVHNVVITSCGFLIAMVRCGEFGMGTEVLRFADAPAMS